MTALYLLDTNVVSEPLKPQPNKRVLHHLYRNQDKVAIASPVWHELWFGCKLLPVSARRSAIEDYLETVIDANFPILPYDEYAAEWHAAERARLSAKGKTPAFVDGQIAAVAMVNKLVLVTFNTADYSSFKDIAIQNWRS